MKKGWEMKTLGDLYEITSSKRVFESEWKRSGVPFYRAREIVKLARQGFVKNELFISEEMYNQYSEKYGIPKEGDIMVTGVGTLGICYVVQKNDKFYFKDGNIIWLKTKNGINSRFVEYAFQSDFLRKQIDDSVGATVGTFTIIKAKNTLIPVPSLPEQQRIVSMLDEAFASIAQAKSNAERNLVNARELFDIVLTEIFVHIKDKKKLGDLCNLVSGFSFKSNDYIEFSNTMNFRMSQIRPGGWVDLDHNPRYLPDEYAEKYKDYLLKDGDIVIAMTDMATETKILGVPTLVKTDDRKLLLNQRVGKFFDINYQLVDVPYLKYVLSSKPINDYYKKLGRGGLQINIGKQDILNAQIPLPPLAEQRAIVGRLEALSAETGRLEEIYQQKVESLEELKKSVLGKAFAGEL